MRAEHSRERIHLHPSPEQFRGPFHGQQRMVDCAIPADVAAKTRAKASVEIETVYVDNIVSVSRVEGSQIDR